MNTILNKIYVTLSMEGKTLIANHNGDDVLAAVDTLKDVQRLSKGATMSNVRFQPNKCYLFSIAEFLRIDHRRNGAQYLSRSVSTFVHGPTESLVPNDLQALLMSNRTRAEELISRGGDREKILRLLSVQSKHTSTQWNISMEDIQIVYDTHLSLGGLSKEISKKALSHSIQTVEVSRTRSEKAEIDAQQTLPGAYDYAKSLVSKMIPKSYFEKIHTAIRKAVLHNSVSKKFSVFIKDNKPDTLATIRAQKYGSLRKEANTQKLSLAKSYGIPIFHIAGSEQTILEQILGETDKLAALKILL